MLLGIILSGEAARYFYGHPDIWLPYRPEYLLSAFLLGFWFLLAVILLENGFVFRSNNILGTAAGALAPAILAMFAGIPLRCEYQEPFNNPFSVVLIAQSLILLALGFQSQFAQKRFAQTIPAMQEKVPRYRETFGIPGIIGIFSLCAILTIEWYYWSKGLTTDSLAASSITLFWALYALVWIVLGFSVRSMPIRVCGLIILFGALVKTALFDSVESWNVGTGQKVANGILLWNHYFVIMLFPVIPALILAVWTNRGKLTFVDTQERAAWKTAGIVAIVALLIHMSIDCYQYFDVVESKIWELQHKFLASTSLTIFWTIAALILTTLAWGFRSKVLRIMSMALLVLTALKVFLDLPVRPEFEMPFLNLYAMPMLVFATVLIALGYLWTHRLTDEDAGEKSVYRLFALGGVIFLWFTMSVECFRAFGLIESKHWKMEQPFLASASLTVFWTTIALILTAAALYSRSTALRMVSMALLVLTALKIVLDLEVRPEFTVPFWNPYFIPIFVFAMVVMAVGCLWTNRLEEDSAERSVYRFIAFSGVVFLWVTLSLECYRAVRLLQGASQEAWRAQMALSILWSVFAGIVIAIGFIWRAPTLRWMAITLFAMTLTKVVIVDMSGVDALYRFGAVFVLACLLMATTYAYQRFKPE